MTSLVITTLFWIITTFSSFSTWTNHSASSLCWTGLSNSSLQNYLASSACGGSLVFLLNHQVLHRKLSDCSETAVFILSHPNLETFEFSCFCCHSLFKFASCCFKYFGLDVILRSQFIFSSTFDVLPSTFNPTLCLTQIFLESFNIIFNSSFPVWLT